MQAGIGLFTGVIVYSTAFGGLFAIVFALVYGRMGELGPRAVAALLAGMGVRLGLSGAKPQISGQPAFGGRSRYDRHAHGVLLRHDRDFACEHDRGIDVAQAPIGPAWADGMRRS